MNNENDNENDSEPEDISLIADWYNTYINHTSDWILFIVNHDLYKNYFYNEITHTYSLYPPRSGVMICHILNDIHLYINELNDIHQLLIN